LCLERSERNVYKYGQKYCAIYTDEQSPSFVEVKKRIFFELVNQDKNRYLLSQIPHVTFNDLAITFYYLFPAGHGQQKVERKIIISNSLCRKWATDTERLFRRALKNTPRERHPLIQDIEELIKTKMVSDLHTTLKVSDKQLVKQQVEKAFNSGKFESINQYIRSDDRYKMYVLTNVQKQYGASTVLYPKVLKALANRLDINFFLLPSSIHEFMLVPDDNQKSVEELSEIVRETNNTAVEVDEILSYSIYYYDRSTGVISIKSAG
jgi:hypothetical protein